MRGKQRLACTGPQLPAVDEIPSPEEPQELADFCQVLNFGDEILLSEQMKSSALYYWMILEADDYPVGVCRLEAYANWLAARGQWTGRRSDYLAIGSALGNCYLVVIELRRVLVKLE